MKKCGFAVSSHVNEFGEKEVFCKFYSRWMNCDLGHCSEKCEHFSIGQRIDYIYRIEVDCFTFEGKYTWRIRCREKNNATAKWLICSLGSADSVEQAFEQANKEVKRMGESIWVI